jgi:hypothetical protein
MAVTSTTIDIGWVPGSHPSLEVRYSVYQDDVFIGDAGTDLTFTATGLTPNTEYEFYVRSRVEYPFAVGDELVINSQFISDTDWDKGPGWNISPGVDGFANNDGQVGDLVQVGVPFTPGVEYIVSFETTSAAYQGLGLRYSLGSNTFQGATSGDGVHEFPQIAGGDNDEIRLIVQNAMEFLGSVQYVSVKEMLRDDETIYSEPSSTITCKTLP